jgi:hypothetical protein
MLPQPKQSFFPSQDDAELEGLLCLAAALQAREQKTPKPAAERRPFPEPTFLRGLQALLKGLRRPQRIRAA